MRRGQCPKCQSLDVIRHLKVIDRGDMNSKHELEVAIQEKPDAWLFKGEVKSSLNAYVCGKCGYTEFYADDPEVLLEAHRKRKGL